MFTKILKAICLVLSILSIEFSSAQTVINYQTWNPPIFSCNVFGFGINVNGVPHKSITGQTEYNNAQDAISLKSIDQGAPGWGTEYRITYNFQAGHRYRIVVNAMSVNGPAGNPLDCPQWPSPITYDWPPMLSFKLNSSTNTGNTNCPGAQQLNLSVYNFPDFQHQFVAPGSFADYTFDSPTLTQSSSYINVVTETNFSSCFQYQNLLIRKITIIADPVELFTGHIIGSPFCGATNITVPYTSNNTTFNSNNMFVVQLSNANGNFSNPTNIAYHHMATATSGNLSATIPGYVPSGSGYRIRIVSSNPYGVSTDNGINLTINNDPVTVTPTQLGCDEIQYNVSGTNATSYSWTVNYGDILFNGTSTTAVTSSPTIYATGTNGSVSVSTTRNCGSAVTAYVDYNPFARGPFGIPYPLLHNEHLSVSVNTTPYDTYYTWRVNGNIVKQGEYATHYCTCYYESNDYRVCGDNTVSVEVQTSCGTSYYEEQFFWYCGYGRSQTGTQYNVEVFPNPAKDQATIRIKEANIKLGIKDKVDEIRQIRVIDKFGNTRKVLRYATGTRSISLNTSDLPADIYIIEVSDGNNKKATLKLSVAK